MGGGERVKHTRTQWDNMGEQRRKMASQQKSGGEPKKTDKVRCRNVVDTKS